MKILKKMLIKLFFLNVKKFNGSISAEHGIGQLRKDELKKYKSLKEIQRMKKKKNF